MILFIGADKRIRNQDNKIPLDLTHDPNVRSLLEDKGNFKHLSRSLLFLCSCFYEL